MKKVRLISRLDVKGQNLIKSVNLEGLRVIGDPSEHAIKYYNEGADEILYIDAVASLYGRNNLSDILSESVRNVFIPITVGGGIRSIEDAKHILRSGADKVAINTAATSNPILLSEIADVFGSQAVVLSIEAKNRGDDVWEVMTDNGREKTGMDVLEWCSKAVELGVGEILITSIDKEGTRQGYDLSLIKAINDNVSVPVIASGGMGSIEDIKDVIELGVDAATVADAIHYNRFTMTEINKGLFDSGYNVRELNL